MKKLKQIDGDLITVDIEVEGLNAQYGTAYDGFILTPQTKRNTVSHLYGFHGVPLDETAAYKVTTYYR